MVVDDALLEDVSSEDRDRHEEWSLAQKATADNSRLCRIPDCVVHKKLKRFLTVNKSVSKTNLLS